MSQFCDGEVSERVRVLNGIPVRLSVSNPSPHGHNYIVCSDKSALIGGFIPELLPVELMAEGQRCDYWSAHEHQKELRCRRIYGGEIEIPTTMVHANKYLYNWPYNWLNWPYRRVPRLGVARE